MSCFVFIFFLMELGSDSCLLFLNFKILILMGNGILLELFLPTFLLLSTSLLIFMSYYEAIIFAYGGSAKNDIFHVLLMR